MKRSIIIPRGLQKDICRIFGLSQFGAWKALNYESNSPRAYKVRKYALENGGIYNEDGVMPNCSIYASEYRMTLTFPCGYVVTYDLLTNRIWKFVNNQPVDTAIDLDISTFHTIVNEALKLSEGDINPPIKNSTKR